MPNTCNFTLLNSVWRDHNDIENFANNNQEASGSSSVRTSTLTPNNFEDNIKNDENFTGALIKSFSEFHSENSDSIIKVYFFF